MSKAQELEKNMMSKAQDLRALVAQVDKKKPAAADVTALNNFLKDNPHMWRLIGDLGDQANQIMLQEMSAPASMKQAIRAGLQAQELALIQPGDGELEMAIIRQIVGCWLRLSIVEYQLGSGTAKNAFNMTQGAYWEKRVSTAQRRYLRAIETLARVRRLRLPAVQVNIAEQQVNQVNTRG